MKITTFLKTELNNNHEIIDSIKNSINEFDCFEIDNINPDVVICVGGDGTLLRAINRYVNNEKTIKYVCINEGSFAFSCDYFLNEISVLLKDLVTNNCKENTISLLSASFKNKEIFALNEIRIENPFHTLIADVNINGEHLETFRGNGLSVCSSFGSTGYNKSLKGAVVDPNLEILQLTEIAPISNRVYKTLESPLIMSKESIIEFSGNLNESIIGYDHLTIKEDNVDRIIIKLSNKTVILLTKNTHSFISRLKKGYTK